MSSDVVTASFYKQVTDVLTKNRTATDENQRLFQKKTLMTIS